MAFMTCLPVVSGEREKRTHADDCEDEIFCKWDVPLTLSEPTRRCITQALANVAV